MIKVDDKQVFFPLKYEPKTYQIEALNFMKDSIVNGKRFILNNLSTGTGKSYLAMMFANWYKGFVNPNAKFDILTGSKILQEQYLKDFNFINNYKGKSNYYCQTFDCQCDTGKELCGIMKKPCDSCPYDMAKNQWITGDIGLTNFHLFNTLSLFQTDILKRRDGNVLIIDECQNFESVFSDYLSSKLSAKILKRCGIEMKEIETLDNRYISKIKYMDKYLIFLETKLIPILEKKRDQFIVEISSSTKSKKKIELTNYIQNIESKLSAFKHLFDSHSNDPENIILDIVVNKNEKIFSGIELVTEHIFVYEYLNEYVWSKYDHIIFMSATILDRILFSFINGLDEDLTSYYEIPSPFALKNRPIYYLKIGKMSFTSKEETFKKQVVWVKKILSKYKDKKGIIHTANYEITEWIKENIMDSRLLFHNTEDRNEILEKHLTSKEPTILVSPSMMEGISLDDELARFQIIMKIPFPSLASKKIKTRQKIKPEWYSYKACLDTIQASGRGNRSTTDYCDTFILDSNFSDLLKYNSNILPQYFIDSIKILKI